MKASLRQKSFWAVAMIVLIGQVNVATAALVDRLSAIAPGVGSTFRVRCSNGFDRSYRVTQVISQYEERGRPIDNLGNLIGRSATDSKTFTLSALSGGGIKFKEVDFLYSGWSNSSGFSYYYWQRTSYTLYGTAAGDFSGTTRYSSGSGNNLGEEYFDGVEIDVLPGCTITPIQ